LEFAIMEATTIRCLRPNVTREEALQTFTSSGPASLYWKWRSGSLQRIADAYIPFRIYRVRYCMNGAHHTHLFALDAVDGSLDLFEFAAPPSDAETVQNSQNKIGNRATPERHSSAILAWLLWHWRRFALPRTRRCASPRGRRQSFRPV
jgi:hypothetical protein